MPSPDAQLEQVIALWRDGERRLNAFDPATRPPSERVRDEIVFELRRRLGGPFLTTELVEYYLEHGTDLCFQIATRVAPNTPEVWDMTAVAGAAFARYVREAGDYAGGRRLQADR